MTDFQKRIATLADGDVPTPEEWTALLSHATHEDVAFARELAHQKTVQRFGRNVYFRGIIEFTNICKKDCLYCGIRRSNHCATRYRLTVEEILSCCEEGYRYGYRTFVLQGGEDAYWTDSRLIELLTKIRTDYSDCAITLSLGERSRKSYQALFDAGADRYLLRHETADAVHYQKLHTDEQSFEKRKRCLEDLKEIGYQVGAGMMVGSPFQTPATLTQDLQFLYDLQPQMVGIGPFIPHRDTPFRNETAGSVEQTLFLISLVRLLLPDALIPATTALGTVEQDGRQQGVLSGCNVVMPNLSPVAVREKYLLYDNKVGIGMDAKSGVEELTRQMNEIGYQVVVGRGDFEQRRIQ